MISKPSTASRWRSVLSGGYIRVRDVKGDIIVITNNDGNRQHVHIRDFNAEYRLIVQQKAVNART